MENMSLSKAEYLAEKRAKAIADGNLVLAEFIASQMPDQEKLTEVESLALRQSLIDLGATLKFQLWPVYFMTDKERAWKYLEKELSEYLKDGLFTESLVVLKMLKSMADVEGRGHRYRQIIESLPTIFFSQDKSNMAFVDFMHLEIAALNPCHKKLVKYYGKIYFDFVERGNVSKGLLDFCDQETGCYQFDSGGNLGYELKALADKLMSYKD